MATFLDHIHLIPFEYFATSPLQVKLLEPTLEVHSAEYKWCCMSPTLDEKADDFKYNKKSSLSLVCNNYGELSAK